MILSLTFRMDRLCVARRFQSVRTHVESKGNVAIQHVLRTHPPTRIIYVIRP